MGVTIGVGPAHVEAVRLALQQQDAAALYAVDFEYAPFWCPKCQACYCEVHYLAWDVFDETFFDCRRGVCPNGHERMLMD